MKNIYKLLVIITLAVLIGISMSACNSSGGGNESGGGDTTITLTLDPEGQGYFEYREIQYDNEITVKVIPGEYLYFYRTSDTISATVSGWSIYMGGIKTTSPVNTDISASFKTVTRITLTLDPEGQGYFEYREIQYDNEITVEVIPEEHLYFYRTSDTISATVSGWSIYLGGIKTTSPVNTDISASFKTVTRIKLTLDPEEKGCFEYNGIEYYDPITIYEIPGKLLYFKFDTSPTGCAFECAEFWYGPGTPCWSEPIMSDVNVSCSDVGVWVPIGGG